MTSNTVEIESHPVNFPSFSVEKRTYKPDPFTIKDSRSVGSDGFVVPKDFPEFFKRFPDYVQRWVSKHALAPASGEDTEDWTQDLLIRLSSLPLTSKYREAGKKDIVATFDPLRHYGANEARFRNYINLCLANKFRTMRSKRMKNALCRPGNLVLDRQTDGEDLGRVDDEYCHSHSAYLQDAAKVAEKQADDLARIQEFKDFVEREDLEALATMKAFKSTRTHGEAANRLGVTEREYHRRRARLRQLGNWFECGAPRKRKPRKRRTAKTTIVSDSRLVALIA